MAKRIVLAALSLAALASFVGSTPAAAYDVKKGDTLWSIARHSGVPMERIARQNHIVNPDRIYAGQRLDLQPSRVARSALDPVRSSPAAYTIRPGDTLWSISRDAGIPVDGLVGLNRLKDPDRIYAGQRLRLAGSPAFEPAAVLVIAPAGTVRPAAGVGSGAQPAVRGAAARRLLLSAAQEQGLDPNFVLAVSQWESGYNQGMVSKAGAIGMMQILPSTGDWAGPALLGRQVDLRNADDNARLGAALLRLYSDQFHNSRLVLAAYYQGAEATREHGIYPGSRQYVDGISSLRNRMENSP